MPGYAISEEQSEKLNTALSDLAVQAEADAVFMSDCGGNMIAHFAQSESSAIPTIAALAAGSFAATRELATLIGEPTFHLIYHQGKETSIYMQSVLDFLLLVIFGRSTTVGLVKLYVEKASKELEPILKAIDGISETPAKDSAHPLELDQSSGIFGPGGQPTA